MNVIGEAGRGREAAHRRVIISLQLVSALLRVYSVHFCTIVVFIVMCILLLSSPLLSSLYFCLSVSFRTLPDTGSLIVIIICNLDLELDVGLDF